MNSHFVWSWSSVNKRRKRKQLAHFSQGVKHGFKIHELKYEVQRFMNWSVIFLICQIQMLWSVYGLLKSIITCSYSDEFSMSSLLWFVKTAFLIEIEIKVVVSTVVLKMIIHYRNCKYLNSFKATYFIKLYS